MVQAGVCWMNMHRSINHHEPNDEFQDSNHGLNRVDWSGQLTDHTLLIVMRTQAL